ncbi:pentatricopeptide repeat-containing protein At4g38010-like isoform X3 [Magnolia sinica]|uniref:pentatricopeptide repeat-containing protein At4g38010-like isoform X3 n=1 Tax=Magnolia sinica TaxID=86752 RepID=UPI002658F4AB|nr:pentatricopeptide repeat-containing protein At4g38010-like isoform X3 [Magnolia sinica]
MSLPTHKWNKNNPLFPNLPLHFPKIPSNSSQIPVVLSLYITSGLLLHSLSNLFSYNSIIRSLAAGPTPHLSISLYNHMRRNSVSPDNYTFPFVLKSCARLLFYQKGRELHAVSLKLGFEYDVFVQNSLIYMYSICGEIETACRVFDFMPIWVRDVVSWNSLISGYVQRGHCGNALDVFVKMLGVVEGFVRPNEVTAVSVLAACSRVGGIELGRRIHAFVVGSGFLLDVFLGSSLIDMYVKCGHVDDARLVFDGMPERNVVCWTSMISGYAQSGRFREAIELFRVMLVVGVEVDGATVACVASACAHLGALDHGRWVHAYCDRNGVEMNVTVKNALIDMYSKCGDIGEARRIFDRLFRRDVFSWTVMISGLAMNGMSDEALDLFSQMRLLGDVRPNEVTFLGVLSACSHGGLVDEGYHHFNCMKKIYNLTPQIEHYGCVVDLLGRANLLVEAENFIKNMPIEPDAVIWRSLLFACRSNRNIELAEFAVKHILELEPGRCGVHVLLSNIYAASLRWNDVKRVRKGLRPAVRAYNGHMGQKGYQVLVLMAWLKNQAGSFITKAKHSGHLLILLSLLVAK